jgi:hypothetical protein
VPRIQIVFTLLKSRWESRQDQAALALLFRIGALSARGAGVAEEILKRARPTLGRCILMTDHGVSGYRYRSAWKRAGKNVCGIVGLAHLAKLAARRLFADVTGGLLRRKVP